MKIEIKKDKKEQFFWTIRAKNGEAIAKSSESYATKPAAKKAIEIAKKVLTEGEVVDLTMPVKQAKPVKAK